mgnify:CR=1 FL=1
MSELYPLKFEPILKEKIWGGDALAKHFGKKAPANAKIGESWELSAVSDNLSVVTNGFLAGNNIEELIEVYMGDLTGEAVYDKFGNEFPLLIKLIEAREDLSVQVHPPDEMARERHNAYGKTEMWYILESQRPSYIYTGFRRAVAREEFEEALENGTLPELLNKEEAHPGDTFFTPAGRIHAIGAGIILAEIQQTSDITYRIYDWGRTDKKGNSRELHTDLALDAIDFSLAGENKIRKEPVPEKVENLVNCEYFHTNIIRFKSTVSRDYYANDSFVIFICTEGKFSISWDSNAEIVTKGETVLLPASITNVILRPEPEASVLEIYIKNNYEK